jgi:hypothetical protein
LIVGGCAAGAGQTQASSSLFYAACTGTAKVTNAGRITPAHIDEASGLAAGRRTAGVWWTHNDSGDAARLYAIDASGGLRAQVVVDGAVNRDWEDIASGPSVAGSGPLLYISGTGNNQAITDAVHARNTARIYRLQEPRVRSISSGAAPVQHVRAAALNLRYPDGAHDAEAMFVDPVTNDLVIITKDWSGSGRAGVYRVSDIAKRRAGSTTALQRVATVALKPGTLVTGADVTRDGRVVVLRSYGAVNLYQRDPGKPVWTAFANAACPTPPPAEAQGESIGFAPDGGSFLTTTEGSRPVVHRTVP